MTHVSYSAIVPFDFQGLQIRELTPAQLQSVSVAEIEVAPGAKHETARSTRSDKLYVCIEGKLSFRVEDEPVSLEPRDLLLIRKGEWFSYRNDGEQPARLILIYIPSFDLQCAEFLRAGQMERKGFRRRSHGRELSMKDNEPIIRPLDYAWDREALLAFLDTADQSRLDQIRPALADGDGFALVAEMEERAVGWVVVHTRYRDDLGWEPDGNTRRFQSGDNAYVENLAVEPGSRNRGIGGLLLAAAEGEASRRGKRCLWLHASETNEGACRFYEREEWSHHSTVHPAWRQGRAMRVYSKASAGRAASGEPQVCRVGVQRGYDLWAETYDTSPNPVVSMDARHTLELMAPEPGEAILDAGCGTGRHLSPLVARGCRPIGVDFSFRMLRVARQRLPTVPLVQGALEQRLPFVDGCFDQVLCALVGEHLTDLVSAFMELGRVLRPGGRLAFSVYHPAMAAAGKEAHFQRSGIEYRLGAIPHTLDHYLDALQHAGFEQLIWHEFSGDAELVAAVPGARKLLGFPVLLVVEALKG
jgi:SAM-dependent methyltransferase/ribosomal protein S18 acetylase RimI-like enzyme/mannose-6-phosphate isomerase-like protein (cupin superfamily)